MSENIIDLLVGVKDGEIVRLTVHDEKSKPQMIELTPKKGNLNFSALKIIKYQDMYIVPTANGSINVWKVQNNVWTLNKTVVLKDQKNYPKTSFWEVTCIDLYGNLLYTGGPTGFIEIWDADKDFAKIDEFQFAKEPICGINVNEKAMFIASEHKLVVYKKEDRSVELYNETFPWGKYSVHNSALNDNFYCLALTARVFGYTFDKTTLKVEKYVEVPNTVNHVTGFTLYFNMCYSAPWDGDVRAWNILSKNPNPIFNATTGSLETIYVDKSYVYLGGHHGEMYILDKADKHKMKHKVVFGDSVRYIGKYV